MHSASDRTLPSTLAAPAVEVATVLSTPTDPPATDEAVLLSMSSSPVVVPVVDSANTFVIKRNYGIRYKLSLETVIYSYRKYDAKKQISVKLAVATLTLCRQPGKEAQ